LPKTAPQGKPEGAADAGRDFLAAAAHRGALGVEGARMRACPSPANARPARGLKRAIAGKIQAYAAKRDLPAADGTSRLSQDLRFGLLSIRTVFAEAMKARAAANAAGRAGIDVFIKELAWREFYFAILHHFPNVLDEEFNPEWRGPAMGRAGRAASNCGNKAAPDFPIVDAGMRELLATGFMHNRVRMITAMFLTKDLHIDWKSANRTSCNIWWMARSPPTTAAGNGRPAPARMPRRISASRIHGRKPPATIPTAPTSNAGFQTERERTLAIFKRHRETNPR
jgi:hypothetical protein